jgi:calcineurin-like phosphoesterase family protein
MSNVFFTSDTHFNHAKIIGYSSRPFCKVEEMDRVMIDNWNSVVKPGDLVYHLGDFAFVKTPELLNFYRQLLNGTIFYIFGNHDRKKWFRKNDKFAGKRNLKEIKVKGVNITLCHYEMKVWNKSHYGAWHLYGHSHTSNPCGDKMSLSLNVGVDAWNFHPVTFEQISEQMKLKAFIPISDRRKMRVK